MAGDEVDYGSARITLDLDDSDAERQARDVGADIERALTRATRNIGRTIRDNITRGLRRVSVAARVTPDLSRFRRELRDGVRGLPDVAVPVTADLRGFQRALRGGRGDAIPVPVTPDVRRFPRALRRALRGLQAEIQVRADARRLVREIERALSEIDPPRLQVEVEADLSRIRSELASLDPPRVQVTLSLDADGVRQELQDLADTELTIPVVVGPAGAAGAAGAAAGSSALAGLTGSLTAAGPWGAVVAAVAGYGLLIGQTLMTGIEGVIEHQRIEGQLRAALGLAEDEAARAGRVVGQLYARGVVETVEDGTAAVQAAIRNGLAAPDDLPALESISSQVADLGALMEEDIGKVARAVGTMVKTGLVDTASEGLDLMAKSVQQGGNVAEDLLDTFTEYPTQFRQLGLSAEEAFGLIQQGLRGGARDSDVIADTLKEFSIEAAQGGERVVDAFKAMKLDAEALTDQFAKGGPDARKALDEIFDALQNIEDPLERNQAAVGLFGTKAEDMAGALASLDLDTAAKEMEGFGGAATKAGDDLRDNLGTQLQRIGREAKQAFQGLFTGDFSQFADVGDAIREALPNLKETGGQIARSIQDGIVEYGPRIFEAVFDLASELGERVDIWGPLLLKIIAGAAALPSIVGGLLLTAIAGGLSGLWAKALPYLEAGWDAVVGFFTETIPAWGADVGSAIADAFASAWQSATGAVSSGTDAVVAWFQALPGRIWEALAALPGILYDLFTSAVAFVIIGLLSAVAGIVFVFTELPGRIYSALASFGSQLLAALSVGFAMAQARVVQWVGQAASWMGQLPGRVYNALASFGSQLLARLSSAFAMARDRILQWVSQAASWIGQLPGRAANALSGLPGRIGDAISRAAGAARRAASGLVSGVVDVFRGLPGAISRAVGNIGSTIMSKVKAGLPSSVRKYLPFADGGIVLGPTHALIGEAGPEVVIPLSRPRRAEELAQRSGLVDMLTRSGVLGADDRGSEDVKAGPRAVHHHNWNLYEVGDAHATAHRVINRLVLSAAL